MDLDKEILTKNVCKDRDCSCWAPYTCRLVAHLTSFLLLAPLLQQAAWRWGLPTQTVCATGLTAGEPKVQSLKPVVWYVKHPAIYLATLSPPPCQTRRWGLPSQTVGATGLTAGEPKVKYLKPVLLYLLYVKHPAIYLATLSPPCQTNPLPLPSPDVVCNELWWTRLCRRFVERTAIRSRHMDMFSLETAGVTVTTRRAGRGALQGAQV